MTIDITARTLLWFRPLSPLHYALPDSLSQLSWASKQHIPIDVLFALKVNVKQLTELQESQAWLLSSPTAAHLAAKLGKPSSIAVMGAPTQQAWRAAGGSEPEHWHVSTTGESMGLLSALSQHGRVAVLRGKQGRNDLIEALRAIQINVQTVAIYKKQQHPRFGDDLTKALAQVPVALYLSSTDQPARVLAAAVDKATLLASPLIVSHERIARAALALGFQTVEVHT